MIEAYKLFRIRKDGTLGSLFIARRAILPLHVWLYAELCETKGFTVRQGWHALPEPKAPHLSMKGRVWCRVSLIDVDRYKVPEHRGGEWLLARRLMINEVLYV